MFTIHINIGGWIFQPKDNARCLLCVDTEKHGFIQHGYCYMQLKIASSSWWWAKILSATQRVYFDTFCWTLRKFNMTYKINVVLHSYFRGIFTNLYIFRLIRTLILGCKNEMVLAIYARASCVFTIITHMNALNIFNVNIWCCVG